MDLKTDRIWKEERRIEVSDLLWEAREERETAHDEPDAGVKHCKVENLPACRVIVPHASFVFPDDWIEKKERTEKGQLETSEKKSGASRSNGSFDEAGTYPNPNGRRER